MNASAGQPIVTLSSPVADYVRRARVARLATVGDDGMPYLVPICFALVDGCLYMALDAKPKRTPVERLKRVRNILERPNVGVVVDHWSEDWTQLGYVQIRGVASVLYDGEERQRALAALREKYPQYRAMPVIDDNPTVRIAPTGVTAWGALDSAIAESFGPTASS